MKREKIQYFFIILIIITCLISSSIYGVNLYFAKDISYNKKDGTEISLKDALDELYNKKTNDLSGKNNKEYKLVSEFQNNEDEGYVPILTSDSSSKLGMAYSNLPNAWYAFNGNDNNFVYYFSENIPYSYVEFESRSVLMKIKKITASIMASNKTYNWYLQYLDMQTNEWVTVKSGTIGYDWGSPINEEVELEEPVYTTAFRVYTDTLKNSGNNFAVVSLQAYP